MTTQNEQQKKVYILLTKQTDPFSRLFGIMSGCKYFHASIGFEERGTFYSFNTKRGFCIEQPSIKRKDTPCVLYSLDVSDEIYLDLEERIRGFRENSNPYGFSHFGMFLAIFRMPLKIPFLFENRYFCSMFVSELIINSGAAKLKLKPHRYLPRHFPHEPALKLCFEGVWGQPPVFSESQGDLYALPLHYAKKYAKTVRRTFWTSVDTAHDTAQKTAWTTMRSMRFARKKALSARRTALRAPGALYALCLDNIGIATKRSREVIILSRETLNKWFR